MKTVEITQQRQRDDKYGGTQVTLEYTVTDEIGRKSAGSADFAVSNKDCIPAQTRHVIRSKLGYDGFTIKPAREILKARVP